MEDLEFTRAKRLSDAINGTHIVNAFIANGLSFATIATYKVHPEKSTRTPCPWTAPGEEPSPYGDWGIKCTHSEIFITQPVPLDALPDNCCDDPHLVHRSNKRLFTFAASNGREYAFRCVHIPAYEDEAESYCITPEDVMKIDVVNPHWCENYLINPWLHKPYKYDDHSPDPTLDGVLNNAGRLADLGLSTTPPQPLNGADTYGFTMTEHPASGDPHIADTKENARLMSNLLSGWFLLGGDRKLHVLHAIKVSAVPNGSNDGVYIAAQHSRLYPASNASGAVLTFRGNDGRLHYFQDVHRRLRDVEDVAMVDDLVSAAGRTRGDRMKNVLYDPVFFMNFGYCPVPGSDSDIVPEFKLDSAFFMMDELNRGAMKLTPSKGNIVLDGGQCSTIEQCLIASGY